MEMPTEMSTRTRCQQTRAYRFELDSGAHFTVRKAADRLTEGTHIAGIYFVEHQVCSADI